jgi:Protein of unknown function (DUF732)
VRIPYVLAGPFSLLALLSVCAQPPAARADAVDNAFVNAVKAKGIDFASPQAAIIAAHEVCDELDIGRQKSDVANEIMGNARPGRLPRRLLHRRQHRRLLPALPLITRSCRPRRTSAT